jgi:ABC-type branched-subunit amino acid transport system ATPase component
MRDILDVVGLRKQFGGVHAVDDLHFSVKKNSITGLIGPNGAGKTTAFNLITQFLPADGGTVFYSGVALPHARPEKVVHMGIARTFQQIRVCKSLTVRENLLLACSKEYDTWWNCFRPRCESIENNAVDKMLKTIGLEHLSESKASELSYGQSKLVELARTLLTGAEVILLDEPASGINLTLLLTIETLIFDLKKSGKTIFVIEHNLPFLMRISDEIIAMENGAFLCQGTPEEVQQNPRLLAAYLGETSNYKLQTSNTEC